MKYVVTGEGRVHISLDYKKIEGLSNLQSFGVTLSLPCVFDQITWYGNGPEETYIDRERGAKLGIFSNTVQDNLAAYSVPQECGNKTAVRFASLVNHCKRGIEFFSQGVRKSEQEGEEVLLFKNVVPMEFCALPYTAHELESAKHHFDLPKVHHTVIRASLINMGIAGDDSWGAKTHEEYLIQNDDLHFEFSFCGK